MSVSRTHQSPSSSTAAVFQPPLFTNYQGWQISCHLDTAERLYFQLEGMPGERYLTDRCIIQNFDSNLLQKLTPANYHSVLGEYLSERLRKAGRYQVHVEKSPRGWLVRFGDFGLKGGGRKVAYALSAAQIGTGSLLCISGVGAFIGTTVVSSGVSGAVYAYNSENYSDREYSLHTVYGLLSGALSGGIEQLALGATMAARIACRILGNTAATMASKAVSEIVQKKKAPAARTLLYAFLDEGFSTIGGMSAHAGAEWVLSYALNTTAFQDFLIASFGSLGTHRNLLPAFQLAQDIVIGSTKAASYTLGSSLASNALTRRRLSYQLLPSMLQTSLISGSLVAVQHTYRTIFRVLEALEWDKIKNLESRETKLNSKREEIDQIIEEKRVTPAVKKKPSYFKIKTWSEIVIRIVEDTLLGANELERGIATLRKKAATTRIGKVWQNFKETEARVSVLIKADPHRADVYTDLLRRAVDALKDQISQERRTTHDNYRTVVEYAEFSHAVRRQLAEEIGTRYQIAAQMISRQVDLDTRSGWVAQNLTRSIQLGQSILSRVLEKAAQVNFEIVSDCDWAEVANHVVLVHAINAVGLFGALMDAEDPRLDLNRIGDEKYQFEFPFRIALTNQGVLGNHLKLIRRQLQGLLERRPTIHWGLGQLVQPHGSNSWEDSQIAVLEPLATFEDTPDKKVYGIAPYDAFSLCEHRLSPRSIVLVPECYVDLVRKHLTDFQGRVIGYPTSETIRVAIVRTIKENFKDAWHLCDQNGRLVGDQVRPTAKGFEPVTYLKKTNGEVIALIKEEGHLPEHQRARAIQENQGKRFIGLHIHSVTFMLEDTKDQYFTALRNFKKDRQNSRLFAGNINRETFLADFRERVRRSATGDVRKETITIGILAALEFYRNILQFDHSTRVQELADYVIDEAFFADIYSVFVRSRDPRAFTFSPLDLKMLLVSGRPYLINLAENIQGCLLSQEETQQEQSMEHLATYCSHLERCIEHLLIVKEEAQKMVMRAEKSCVEGAIRPLCLVVEEEWERVALPEEITFDLGQLWPPNDELLAYINKLLRTLPLHEEALVKLYGEVLRLTPTSRKEQYQINVILNVIKWLFQEMRYAEREQGFQSLFMTKALHSGLAAYGLIIRNDTDHFHQGNSLLDNVAGQLGSSSSSHLLRQQMVGYMREQQGVREQGVLKAGNQQEEFRFNNQSEYLELVARPDVWLTEFEVEALAKSIDHPIVVLQPERPPLIYHRQSDRTPVLLYAEGGIYQSCIPAKELTIAQVYAMIQYHVK